jgi:hypothetical protein
MGAPAVVEHRWEYCEEDAEKLESSQPDGSWLASTVQGSVEDGVEASEPWVDAVHQRTSVSRKSRVFTRDDRDRLGRGLSRRLVGEKAFEWQ